MAKIYLCIIFIAAVVGAHKIPFLKFRAPFEDYKKVACTPEMAQERDSIIEKSKCGEPKEVFVPLTTKKSYEQVTPSSVWVKRCVGVCEFENGGNCVAFGIAIKRVPVRIYNAKTNKESCAIFEVDEHWKCKCCAQTADACEDIAKVFIPRKCSCQCPNLEERRSCLKKRNQHMKWNRSKCSCEKRRKFK